MGTTGFQEKKGLRRLVKATLRKKRNRDVSMVKENRGECKSGADNNGEDPFSSKACSSSSLYDIGEIQLDPSGLREEQSACG